MHAETKDIGQWWARPRGAETAQWIANYQRSLQNRQRSVIVDLVRTIGATDLLEVGCHCGPNLMRLAEACPSLQMIGIDISAEAIAAGTEWAAQRGVSDRVRFHRGGVPESLEQLPTGSADVVLSCYTLAYQAPGDVDRALYELGRLAAKAVILVEPQVLDDSAPTAERRETGYREWMHDYRARQSWVSTLRTKTATIVPIDPPVQRLNAALVFCADSCSVSDGNMQSGARRRTRRRAVRSRNHASV